MPFCKVLKHHGFPTTAPRYLTKSPNRSLRDTDLSQNSSTNASVHEYGLWWRATKVCRTSKSRILGAANSRSLSLEFAGTLLGFDDYVSQLKLSLAYADALLMKAGRHGARGCHGIVRFGSLPGWREWLRVFTRSDYNGTNTKLSKIMLNGNHICMVTLV